MPATATPKRSVTSRAKTASNKAASAAKANGSANGGNAAGRRSAEAILELANKIKAARDAGKSWTDIKSELGVDPAQGQYLIKVASVRPKDRIKFTDDKDLAKQAKELRKTGLSKAEIAARAGVSVGHVRKVLGPEAAPAVKPKAAKPAAKIKGTAAAKVVADKPAAGKAQSAAATKVRHRRRVEVAADPSPAA